MSQTPDTGSSPETNEVREALGKILNSENFSRSPKISRLLSYLVEKQIAGGHDGLREIAIATSVFNQQADFNPRTNPIVRVNASRLRNLLRLYYAGAGVNDGVRIMLPDVGYAPDFARATIKPSETPPAAESGAASIATTGANAATETSGTTPAAVDRRQGAQSSARRFYKTLSMPSSVAFVLANLVIACVFAVIVNRTNAQESAQLISLPEQLLAKENGGSLIMVCSREATVPADATPSAVYPVAIGENTVFCRPFRLQRTVLGMDPA